MKKLTLSLILILFTQSIGFTLDTKQNSDISDINVAKALSNAFKNVVSKITPSLVHISPIKKVNVNQNPLESLPENHPFREFFGNNFKFKQNPGGNNKSFKQQQGLGTGFLIDENGHILTNNHVINGADEVKVTLSDNRKFDAEIIGLDPKTDLAVLKINAKELTPLKLGDSDNLKIGEWVIAAGNPFGFDNSYTAGIVSGKGRSLMRGTQYEDFIQTDAAINPGNSGGPLVNLDGEVVGINTAIFTRSGGYMGLGFAIPVTMAKSVVNSLIKDGKVVRGWLGVAIQDLTSDLASSFGYKKANGALVGDVTRKSPAEDSGIMPGDIIVEFNDKTVLNVEKLRHMVALVKPNTKINAKIWRDGNFKNIKIKIGELKQDSEVYEEEKEYSEDIGIQVDDINRQHIIDYDLNVDKGVIVINVDQYGLAAQAGIESGNLILKVGDKNISSAKEFNKLVSKASLKNGLRLVIESDGMKRFVFLKDK